MKENKNLILIVAAVAFLVIAVSLIYFMGSRQRVSTTGAPSPSVVSQEEQELEVLDIGDVESDLQSIDQDLQQL